MMSRSKIMASGLVVRAHLKVGFTCSDACYYSNRQEMAKCSEMHSDFNQFYDCKNNADTNYKNCLEVTCAGRK
jgi:hypothetical protein